jgi:F-box-like
MEFPVEIITKIFCELDVEDVWSARAVCRYWHDVFELVAYASTESPLTDIKVGVDVVCEIPLTDDCVDRHIVHGDLALDLRRKICELGPARHASWITERRGYEYWPRGDWRRHSLMDVLADVKLEISGLPSARRKSVCLHLGPDVSVGGSIIRKGVPAEIVAQLGVGKFKDFTLIIDTVEEPSYRGSLAIKHSITGLIAPKWQIFALLVHHAKSERELTERLHRNYLRSFHNMHKGVVGKTKGMAEQVPRNLCAVNVWMQLPPSWNTFGTVEV